MQSSQKIEMILQSGYDFRFGTYIMRGWDIFLKGFWGFAGFTFLSLAIQMGMGVIPVIGYIGSLLITVPLNMGYYIVAHRLEKGEGTEFQHFFRGFDFMGPLVMQAAVQGAVIFAALAPAVLSAFPDFMEADFMERVIFDGLDFEPSPWTFVLWIPLIYLMVAWRWAPLFIIFYSMSFWEALETSRRMLTRQWWIFLGFYFVAGLIAASGVIFFLVGFIFTMAFLYCADYAAFADITRLGEEEQEDITDHFIA